jgi:S1-C subfamily serine protease
VPSGVGVCRCGASRDEAAVAQDSAAAAAAPAIGVPPAAIWAATLTVVAAGALWLWSSAAPVRPIAAGAPDTLPATTTAAAPAPRSASQEQPLTSESMAAESAPASVALDPPSAPRTTPPPAADPPRGVGVEDLVARATLAVVMVEAPGSRGTGFFVGDDLLVTNDHVVNGATSVTVRLDSGRSHAARVERTVPDVDLALLRTAPGTAPAVLALASVASVRTGQEVIAIGSALGLQNTVTRGIISARRQAGSVVLLQTDAAINPGNSGGPLLDRQGLVLGVTTLKIGGRAEGLGFAVAADHVLALMDGRSSAMVAAAAGAPAADPASPRAGGALAGFGAAKSGADVQRDAGEQTFDREMAAAAQKARQIDGYWDRYQGTCAPRPWRGGDRAWFGLGDDPAAAAPTGRSQNCPYWLNDLRTMSREFEAAMRMAADNARRAGVYPGTLRDVRRRHRLDWTGFDR